MHADIQADDKPPHFLKIEEKRLESLTQTKEETELSQKKLKLT